MLVMMMMIIIIMTVSRSVMEKPTMPLGYKFVELLMVLYYTWTSITCEKHDYGDRWVVKIEAKDIFILF